ncbi:MAG: hypothetical protein ACXVCV_19075, partial [Polyangia bacterium]
AGSTEVHVTLVAAPSPGAAEIARRGALAEAGRTVGGYIAGGARAAVTLLLVERGGRVLGKSSLPIDEQLTSGALAAAVDGLLGEGDKRGTAPLPVAWYRRPLVWGIAGGVAAAALGVGLGVGLSSRESGVGTRVDLGPAR